MLKLLKVIPALALVGGLVYLTPPAREFINLMVDKAKGLATTMEISRIKTEVNSHFLSSGEIPGVGKSVAFADFLRTNFTPRFGSRDAANDLWDNEYLIRETKKENQYVVISRGANGILDGCASQIVQIRKMEEDPLGAGTDNSGKSSADDICATLVMFQRDTPFRAIP